jgi:hypothetical protein
VALIILGSHSVLADKEIRYLYPVRPIVLTLAALGIVELMEAYNARSRSPLSSSSRTIVLAGLAFFALTSSSLALIFPHWADSSGGLISMDHLSRDSSVCGVGIYGGGWGETGGYSHLHRNVPIVLILNVSDFKKEASSFDSVILPLRLRETLNTPGQGFKLERCWNGVCLYRRPGFCSPPADQHEINGALKLTGY